MHKQRCLIESQIIVIQRLRENKHNRTIGMLQCCITENAHVRRFVVHRNTIGYLWRRFHIRLMHLLNRQCLAFLPVSKARTNKLYFCRQCMYIVYICIWHIKMYIFICPTSIKLKFSRELQYGYSVVCLGRKASWILYIMRQQRISCIHKDNSMTDEKFTLVYTPKTLNIVSAFETFCPQTFNHVHVDCMKSLKIPKG